MSIRRKPKSDVNDFIQAAAIEPQTVNTPSGRAVQPVKLRLDAELLAKIDSAVSARQPSPSRHQWILEAIFEKLKSAD